jgi:hypothetical protein
MKTRSHSRRETQLQCYNCGVWLDKWRTSKRYKERKSSPIRVRQRSTKSKTRKNEIKKQAQQLEEAVEEVRQRLIDEGKLIDDDAATTDDSRVQTPNHEVSNISTVHWDNLILIEPEEETKEISYNLRSKVRRFNRSQHLLPVTSNCEKTQLRPPPSKNRETEQFSEGLCKPGDNLLDLGPEFWVQVNSLLKEARKASDNSSQVLKAQL